MTRPTPPSMPSRNLFDYQIYEGILFGGCGHAIAEPTASAGAANPVTDPHTKGCCRGTNPNCHGCDRCGPRG